MSALHRRILIIDDNEAIHKDFRKILSPEAGGADQQMNALEAALFGGGARAGEPKQEKDPGFELSSAFQGQQGVDMARQALAEGRPFPLAFVDMRMPPGMDGLQTIEALWAFQPDLQVVVCSAYSDHSWGEIVSRLGVTHNLVILKKPFDPVEVLQLAHAMSAKWEFGRSAAARESDLESRVQARTRDLAAASEALNRQFEERERLERHLQHSQKMEAVGQLAAGVAHDFNNLLTVIRGQIGLVRDDASLPAGLRDAMEEIAGAANRASDMTRKLLAFSRRDRLERRPVRLDAWVRSELSLLRTVLGDAVTITEDHDPGQPPVMVDPGSLSQMLLNLAVNARDAMSHGGNVHLSTRGVHLDAETLARFGRGEMTPGNYTILGFSDNGSGIPDDVLPRIFEPFFTTKPVGKGSGMGLAMVYGLIHHHGGWVEVRTSAQGTVFYIVLPATTQQPTEPPERVVQPAVPVHRGETVLVVDDEPAVRLIMQKMLEKLGHRVLTAENGVQGFAVWQQHAREVTVLVTDVTMPGGMSGLDLSQKVRELCPDLPVVFVSGYNAELFEQSSALGEAQIFLPKPFEAADVQRALDQVLEVRSARQALPA